jgi:hypothetical protein
MFFFLSFAPHYYDGGRPQISVKAYGRRRSTEKTGLKIFTCLSCGGADRREKVGGGLLIPWQPLVKF